MDQTSWMSRVGLALGILVAMVGCGAKAVPCSGSNCYPISGTYLVTYTPKVSCPVWVYEQDPTSQMTITAGNAAASVTLTPSAVSPPHSLTGAENTDGNISVTEMSMGATLGIPYAQLNGSFSPISSSAPVPPFQFTGTMQLIPTETATAADGGSVPGCSATYNILGQQQTDGNGNPVGSGTGTDAG